MTIATPEGLRDWEATWDGRPADPSTLPPARIFLPALLGAPDIRFVAVYRNQQVVAGAIANRCLATTTSAFPGLPLVGYERGEELAIAERLGFRGMGALRVLGYAAAG